MILRAQAWGVKAGKRRKVTYDLFDYRDLETGLFAMNRTVGFTASIAAQLVLAGKITAKGVLSPVRHVPRRGCSRRFAMCRRGSSSTSSRSAGWKCTTGWRNLIQIRRRARPKAVHLVLQNASGPQPFRDRLSDSPKNILLSPSGGGEDESEGVNCGEHPPHPYPLPQMGERELRKAAVGPPPRGHLSPDVLSEQHWG
ncbi:MAG: hypothetical protein H6Q51_2911 [Deltaproteobacteria bacterium]|nr:hypothetical protein [Deltaproteobacteria bacterium]